MTAGASLGPVSPFIRIALWPGPHRVHSLGATHTDAVDLISLAPPSLQTSLRFRLAAMILDRLVVHCIAPAGPWTYRTSVLREPRLPRAFP